MEAIKDIRKRFVRLAIVLGLFVAPLTVSGQHGWTVGAYMNNMDVFASVYIDGVLQTTGSLGAFVGADCRGYYDGTLTHPLYGTTYFQVTAGSDLASGETLTFIYWDGTDFYDVTETVAFVANTTVGDAQFPESFNYTSADTEDPVSTSCPADISTTNDAGVCGAVVNYSMPLFSDNVDGTDLTGTLTAGQASGTTFDVGVTTVTYEYTDAAGNGPVACTFTVTVADDENPTITAPTAVIVNSDADLCTATGVTLGTPVTDDNCSVASVVSNAVEPFALGTTVVTWTVTDGSGNTSSATQVVTVSDDEDPTITAPADVSVSSDAGVCTASTVALGSATTDDNCSVASTTNDAPAVFPLGATTVTWTVTDGSGNTSSATQLVTVSDDEDPTITAPTDVSVSSDAGVCTASSVALGSATTDDNCSVASTTNDAPAVFPLGATTVTWTVTDGSGNTSSATQLVTVSDDEDPTITAPIDVTVNADPGVCTATGVALGTPTTNDNCSVADVSDDGLATYPLGVTTVTWTVTDGSGNTAQATQTVTVLDNQDPYSTTCPADITVNNDVGVYGALVTYSAPVFADNCAGSGLAGTMISGQASGTIFPIGTTSVVYEYTDPSGNTGTCSFDVTVNLINRAPSVASPLLDLAFDDGFGSVDIPLAGVFTDTDYWDNFTYTASSSNSGIVDVSVIANTTLRITGTTYGIINVTVRATDDGAPALYAEDVFQVDVNGAPTVVSAISDISIDEGFGSTTVALAGVFSDPEGDQLYYDVVSSNPSVASVSITGTTLTITEENYGLATITVTVDDGSTLSVDDAFVIDINGSPVLDNPIDDVNLDEGFVTWSMSLAGVFSDPENDVLYYGASSSNTSVANVSLAGNTLTISEGTFGYGIIDITVTVNDGSTLSTFDIFQVDINGSPVVASQITDIATDEGFGFMTVPIAGVFSDPEGDNLSYTVSSSDESVVTVVEDGVDITITERGYGVADITIVASDGSSLTAADVFEIDINGAPYVSTEIPDVSRDEGFTSVLLNLNDYFTDPESDPRSYSALSQNTDVVTVNVVNNILTISEVDYGITNIEITCSDGSTLDVTDIFEVDVNAGPVVAAGVSDLAIDAGYVSTTVDLSGAFSDPDGDQLTYEATAQTPGIVLLGIVDDVLTITELTHGITNITVTASDGSSLSVSDVFEFDVNGAPTVTTPMNDISRDDGFSNVIIDMNAHFGDPENDALTYTAIAADAGIVNLIVSGNILMISNITYGVTDVTITASDGSSLNVTDVFNVDVNGAPQVAAGVADQYLDEGFVSTTIDISGAFIDPENDPMTYQASSDNLAVAFVGMNGTTLTITELGYGTANITIRAYDGSTLNETTEFLLDINGAPIVAAGINDVALDETYGTHQVNLLGAFADPENDQLSYEAESGDEGIATVGVVGNILTITEQGFGITDITVTASDGSTLEVSTDFELDVNGGPVVAAGVSDVLVDEGFVSMPIDLTGAFNDPENDGLTYSVSSDNASVASASVFGTVLTVNEVNHGVANITVTASDGSSLNASYTFEMYINGSPEISATPLADVNLDDGFGTTTIDLNTGFDDPEGDQLYFAAVSSSPGIVAVSLTDNILTLTGSTYGVVLVTVTCDDGSSLSVQDQFLVDVNGAPVISGTPLADVSLDNGYGTFDIDVSGGFDDPENDNLSYSVESLNESVVTVSVDGDIVTLHDQSYGITFVRVTASDGSTLTVLDEFEVDVNGAPTVAVPLTDITEDAGFLSTTVDLSATFGDPEDDALTYTATSSNESVVTVVAEGTTLTITEVRNGNSTITVTASDGSSLSVDNSFDIDVVLPAGWQYNPADYSLSGQITAQVHIDRDQPITGYLGAFVGDECRGVAVASYFSFTDTYVYNLIAYSDEVSGEYLHFKYYDQLTNTTYEIHDSIAFSPDMTVGSALAPVELHYYLDFQTDMISGWNWFSFNLTTANEDMSLGALLPGCVVSGDYIKSQTASSTYFNGYGWFGELTELEAKSLYKAFFNDACEINTYGTSADAGNTPIFLNNGWTWLGYLPQETMPLDEALGGLILNDQDFIKSQTASATYYEGYGWFGGLTSMSPGEGYMVRLSTPAILVFPESSSKKSGYLIESEEEIKDYNPHKFEFNGTITARVFKDDVAIGAEGDRLMAYVGEECRGSVEARYFDPSNAYTHQLMIHSNEAEGELITFKYYSAADGMTYLCREKIEFVSDMVLADAFDAFALNLDNAVKIDERGNFMDMTLRTYPNPFSDKLNIELTLPSSTKLHLGVFDVTGKLVYVIDDREVPAGTYSAEWNANDLPSATYILKAVMDEQQIVKRVVLID